MDEEWRAKVSVPVSAVITASFCPMRLYLERKTGNKGGPGPEYTICRQIASHLGRSLDGDRIWEEVLAMDPGMDPRMRIYLDDCIARCAAGGPWRIPSRSDVPLTSGKFGLHGNVDKIFEGEPHFAVVRAGLAPPAGVAPADRLRVFGYMLLLSDGAEIPAPCGAVEYIPSGISRLCFPHPIDKRRFFNALSSARDILSGKEPARSPGPRCRSCPAALSCSPMGKRLSDLL